MGAPMIVVLCDEPDRLDGLQGLLTEAQYRVTRWRTAAGAQALIRRSQPDLVILELSLEQWEAERLLLDRLCADAEAVRIPTLVCSPSWEWVHAREEALRCRGCRAVVRPVAPDHLLMEIRAALEERNAT